MEIDTNGIGLGDRVRDSITGLEGIVIGFHQYLTGCARVSLQPAVGSDGKVPDAYAADVLTLELIAAAPSRAVNRSIGGPRRDPHSRV